jgi:outer membrane protein TolC
MASIKWISASRRQRRTGEIRRQRRQGKSAENVIAFVVRSIFVAALVITASVASAQSDGQSYSTFDRFLTVAQREQAASGVAEVDVSQGSRDDVSPVDTPAPSVQPLSLADVIASLYQSFPEIARARQQTAVASGELLSANGAYDLKFEAFSLSEPTGFYENYRNGLGVARQTWWGGYVSAGYRIGRGFYQPWYKERQTDDAGEFKAAFAQPLLQGRAIDPQRVALFQASLAQQAAQPIVQRAILDASRDAAAVYWQWVASGAVLEAQRELLSIAEKRGQQFAAGVAAGKFAEIDLILNQQLIAERSALALQSEQKFRASAIKLSLYLRDDAGQPLIPIDGWLPSQFPVIQPPPPSDLDDSLAAALARRPEPQILTYELRTVQQDRRLARNEMLPRIDLVAEASQDMGEPATSSDDKGEFELVVGFLSEVPIQRRKARGKIQSTTAKLAQINEKIRLTQNKIAVELQTARNALLLSSQVVQQSELALRAAVETLERYRFAFDRGKIDLIYLNLLETKTNEAEIELVEAQRNWFAALIDMQIALGLDPLERAMAILALPPSEMPGPGRLPKPEADDAQELEKDWELHTKPR